MRRRPTRFNPERGRRPQCRPNINEQKQKYHEHLNWGEINKILQKFYLFRCSFPFCSSCCCCPHLLILLAAPQTFGTDQILSLALSSSLFLSVNYGTISSDVLKIQLQQETKKGSTLLVCSFPRQSIFIRNAATGLATGHARQLLICDFQFVLQVLSCPVRAVVVCYCSGSRSDGKKVSSSIRDQRNHSPSLISAHCTVDDVFGWFGPPDKEPSTSISSTSHRPISCVSVAAIVLPVKTQNGSISVQPVSPSPENRKETKRRIDPPTSGYIEPTGAW